jgi:hypothetical protein
MKERNLNFRLIEKPKKEEYPEYSEIASFKIKN